jgi:hypothetical protein
MQKHLAETGALTSAGSENIFQGFNPHNGSRQNGSTEKSDLEEMP